MKGLHFVVSTVSRAMLARILFAAHSIIAISQMVEVYGETAYWGFTLLTCSIFIEGFLTILQREGQEAKWFCPSVFLYLCSVVPPIWYLQLDLSDKRFRAFRNHTTYEELERQQGSKTELEMRFKISHELWIQMLEQTLLVVLIVGRWLLPKGDITREQLSQILLAYLAIASDIVELFDVFKEDVVNRSSRLPRAILIVWTLSVLQFPLVLTTSRARKMRVALTASSSDEEIKRLQYMATCEAKARPKWVQVLGDVDIWAIVVACWLQDLPFLAVRLYLMVGYHMMSYTMIFFTCKNVLVILLQFYRLLVIVHERYRGTKIEEDARRLTQHYRQMLHACKDVLTKLKEEGTSHVTNITSGRGRHKKVAAGQAKAKQAKAGGTGGAGGSGSGKTARRQRQFEDIREETDESSVSPKATTRSEVVIVVREEPKATVKTVGNGGKGGKGIAEIEMVQEPVMIHHSLSYPACSNRASPVEIKLETPQLVSLADVCEATTVRQDISPGPIRSPSAARQSVLSPNLVLAAKMSDKTFKTPSPEAKDMKNGGLVMTPK